MEDAVPAPDSWTLKLLTKNFSKRPEDRLTKDELKHLKFIRSSVSADAWKQYEQLGRASEKAMRAKLADAALQTPNVAAAKVDTPTAPVLQRPGDFKDNASTTGGTNVYPSIDMSGNAGTHVTRSLHDPNPVSVVKHVPATTSGASRFPALVSAPTEPLFPTDIMCGALYVRVGTIIASAASTQDSPNAQLLPFGMWEPRYVSLSRTSVSVWENYEAYATASRLTYGGSVLARDGSDVPAPVVTIALTSVSVIMGAGTGPASDGTPTTYCFRLNALPNEQRLLAAEEEEEEAVMLRFATASWSSLSSWFSSISEWASAPLTNSVAPNRSTSLAAFRIGGGGQQQSSLQPSIEQREEEEDSYGDDAGMGSPQPYPSSYPRTSFPSADPHSSSLPGMGRGGVTAFARRVDMSEALGRVSDVDQGVRIPVASGASPPAVRTVSDAVSSAARHPTAAAPAPQAPPSLMPANAAVPPWRGSEYIGSSSRGAQHSGVYGPGMDWPLEEKGGSGQHTSTWPPATGLTKPAVSRRLLVETESWHAYSRGRRDEHESRERQKVGRVQAEEEARQAALARQPSRGRARMARGRGGGTSSRPPAESIVGAKGMRDFARQMHAPPVPNPAGQARGMTLAERTTEHGLRAAAERVRDPSHAYCTYSPARMDGYHRAAGIPVPSASLQSFTYHSGYEGVGWRGRALSGAGAVGGLGRNLTDSTGVSGTSGGVAGAGAGEASFVSYAPDGGSGPAWLNTSLSSFAGPFTYAPPHVRGAGAPPSYGIVSPGGVSVSVPVLTSITAQSALGRADAAASFSTHKAPSAVLGEGSEVGAQRVVATRALSPGVRRQVMWPGQAWPVVQATVLGLGQPAQGPVGATPPPSPPPSRGLASDPLSGLLLDHIATVEAALKDSEAERHRLAQLMASSLPAPSPSPAQLPTQSDARLPSGIVETAVTSPDLLSARLSALSAVARGVREGLTGPVGDREGDTSALSLTATLPNPSAPSAPAPVPEQTIHGVQASLLSLQASMHDLSLRLHLNMGNERDRAGRAELGAPFSYLTNVSTSSGPAGGRGTVPVPAEAPLPTPTPHAVFAVLVPRHTGRALPGVVKSPIRAHTTSTLLCNAQALSAHARAVALDSDGAGDREEEETLLLRFDHVFGYEDGKGGTALRDAVSSLRLAHVLGECSPRGHAHVCVVEGEGMGQGVTSLCDVALGGAKVGQGTPFFGLLPLLLSQAFACACERLGTVVGDGSVHATVHAVLVNSEEAGDGRGAVLYDVLVPPAKRGGTRPRLSMPPPHPSTSLSSSRLWATDRDGVWLNGAVGVRVSTEGEASRVAALVAARVHDIMSGHELGNAGVPCCLAVQVDLACMGVPAGRLVLSLLAGGGGAEELVRPHVMRSCLYSADTSSSTATPPSLTSFEQYVLPTAGAAQTGTMIVMVAAA